jgi:hypothetical protein
MLNFGSWAGRLHAVLGARLCFEVTESTFLVWLRVSIGLAPTVFL